MSMRKLSFLAMMFMALSLPMTMVSCGDDDDPAGEQGGPGGEDGNKDDEGGNGEDDGGSGGLVQLDSIRQKMILEETANELLSRVDAADFRVAAGLLEFVDQNSADGSDISKWADAGLELCCANATDSLVEMVYSMSNFCGRFELRDGRWLLSPDQVGYLEFNFTDGEGEPCSLRLVCSGYNTLIHHASFDEYSAEATNAAGQSVRVSQRVENSFVLPERIDVTLTKGGSTVATAELASTVQLRGGDNEFDYKRDAVDLALAVSVGEYRWAIDRMAFEAGSSASYIESLSKAGEQLIALRAEASGDLTNDSDLKGDITVLELSILDRVQVKGRINSVEQFAANLENASYNERDEALFKDYLDRANQLLEMGIYYNQESQPAASIKLYPFAAYGYGGERWYNQPVITFGDGTSYSTFESFFSQDAFQSVIQRFTDLAADFVGLVNPDANIAW